VRRSAATGGGLRLRPQISLVRDETQAGAVRARGHPADLVSRWHQSLRQVIRSHSFPPW
jgi:hypothetical protein